MVVVAVGDRYRVVSGVENMARHCAGGNITSVSC